MKRSSLVLGVFSILVLVSLTAAVLQSVFAQKGGALIVDFEAAKSSSYSNEQQQKNRRQNQKGAVSSKSVITELPDGYEVLPINGHWWVGLPPLPVEKADAIFTGTVVGAEGFLSEDLTSVYGDYKVKIDEVFSDPGKAISSDTIQILRVGGGGSFCLRKDSKIFV